MFKAVLFGNRKNCMFNAQRTENKLCNSYTMEHHTVKKNNVQLLVTNTEKSQNSENKKVTKYTKTSLYTHQKHAKQNEIVFRTHILTVDCKDK